MDPDPVPAGTPLTSGLGAPVPWNINDIHIWRDAILKYACIEAPSRNPLQAGEFALSDTARRLRNTYQNQEEKERTIDDKLSVYYDLLEACLQSLDGLGVLSSGVLSDSSDASTYTVYYRTYVLANVICPQIHSEPNKMHDINSILKDYMASKY